MRFLIFAIAMSLLFGFHSNGFAQQTRNDDIQQRLDELKTMIVEEQNTIALLETQLKSAITDSKTERAEQLRNEITAAYDSLEKMKELQEQLDDLRESSGEASDDRPTVKMGATRRRVPNPSLGGLDSKEKMDRNEPRVNRDQGRRRNVQPGERRPVNRVRSGIESAKLGYLNEAFEALLDAGETELAEDVQDAIDREEKRMERNARSNQRDQEKSGNRRRGDGAMEADSPARPSRRTEREVESIDKDAMNDLEDQINRLREKLDDLKKSGGDGR